MMMTMAQRPSAVQPTSPQLTSAHWKTGNHSVHDAMAPMARSAQMTPYDSTSVRASPKDRYGVLM